MANEIASQEGLIDMERKECESVIHDHDHDLWVIMVGCVYGIVTWMTSDIVVPSTHLVNALFQLHLNCMFLMLCLIFLQQTRSKTATGLPKRIGGYYSMTQFLFERLKRHSSFVIHIIPLYLATGTLVQNQTSIKVKTETKQSLINEIREIGEN